MKNSRKSVQGNSMCQTQRQKRRAREGSLEEKVPPWSLNGRPGERAFQIEGLKWARARVCEMPQVCEHVCVAGQGQKRPAVWDWPNAVWPSSLSLSRSPVAIDLMVELCSTNPKLRLAKAVV